MNKLQKIEDLLNFLEVPFHINNKSNVNKTVCEKEIQKLYSKLKSEEFFLKQISALFKKINDDRYKLKIIINNGSGFSFTIHGLNCSYFDTPILYHFYRDLYLFWLGRDSTT